MVVLNERIGAARFSVKSDANSLDTFKSVGAGYLGSLVNQKPIFDARVERKHTLDTPFDISRLDALPKVDILYGYQNDNGYLYDAAVAHGAKGIVVAGVGAGSESNFVLPSIKKAIDKGVVVVRSTRAQSGYIPEDPAYLGLLGDSLSPAKARILLMLALTLTQDPEQIQAMLHTY
jgi:L-asparaginase